MTPEQRERADFYQHWHEAINRFHRGPVQSHQHWMYEAKTAATELSRLAGMFRREREGKLPVIHVQCATMRTPPQEVPDNHLTCALGVECRKCPFLLAMETGGDRAMTLEQQDEARAWLCLTHIISEGGDKAGEGYLLDETDKLYWSGVYESLAGGPT